MTRILMSEAKLGSPVEGAELLVVQVAGALYCGFAEIDWMGRGNGNPLRQPASS